MDPGKGWGGDGGKGGGGGMEPSPGKGWGGDGGKGGEGGGRAGGDGGGQVMPRLAAQLAGRVGTGQLNALALAVPPQNEAEMPAARHCVVVR